MTPIRYRIAAASLVASACLAAGLTTAQAAASADEVARLGKDFTPMGAERAGSADGAIPAWDGGLPRRPSPDPATGYPDPYASEKPVATITAANAAQFEGKLSAGQLALLKRYPDLRLSLYPTHRSAAYPASVYDAVKAEAGRVQLTGGGTGVTGLDKSTVPFPIPKSGVEVMWNHMTRYRGGSLERHQTQFPVQASGGFTPVTRTETIAFSQALGNPEPNRLLYYITTLTGPSSMAGESNLLHATLDQTKEPNQVWAYNPGQRRVLRAPDLCCDAPQIGADGLSTIDDYDGFFAPTDRYDWKLVGKKEMVVSANNYRLMDRRLKYADLVKPTHLDSDKLRYELHRVWVVEATLKPGARHVYARRTFYFDEDTWQMTEADEYDGRGELWRVHEMHAVPFDDVPMTWYAGDVVYDLQARRYIVFGLTNQEKPVRFGIKTALSDFSVEALRRAGR